MKVYSLGADAECACRFLARCSNHEVSQYGAFGRGYQMRARERGRKNVDSTFQLLDFRLGLFELGCFQELPFAVSSCYGEIVCARHIKNIDGPTLPQGVGTHNDHLLAGESAI